VKKRALEKVVAKQQRNQREARKPLENRKQRARKRKMPEIRKAVKRRRRGKTATNPLRQRPRKLGSRLV